MADQTQTDGADAPRCEQNNAAVFVVVVVVSSPFIGFLSFPSDAMRCATG